MKNKMIGLSQGETSAQALKLFNFLKNRIKGQDPVISNFIKYFEGLISGLRRPNSPVYKGLFLGFPNVGKRLFIESLAQAFFGDKKYYSEISCGAFNVESVSAVPALLSRAEIDLPSLMRDKNYCRIFTAHKVLHEKLEGFQIELFNLCTEAKNDSVNSEDLKNKISAVVKKCNNFIKAINVLEEKLEKYKPENQLSIVVFSDFEKSCPAMLNIIQRILRDGRVRFENGEEVDLTNSIVIVTSTIVSDSVLEEIKNISKGSLGFEPPAKAKMEKMDKAIYKRFADTKKIYKSSIRFVTENINLDFLSLFDRISIFRPLFKDSLKEILDLELNKFYNELMSVSFPITLKLSDEVVSFIIDESSDKPEFGASTLLAKFDKYIRREISRLKNRGEIKEGDNISVELKDKKVIFSRELRKEEGDSLE